MTLWLKVEEKGCWTLYSNINHPTALQLGAFLSNFTVIGNQQHSIVELCNGTCLLHQSLLPQVLKM